MTKRNILAFVVAAIIVAFVGMMATVDMSVTAAPAAAPTPLGAGAGIGKIGNAYVEFANAQSIAADTEICRVIEDFEKLDMHSFVDMSAVNTTTVSVRYTNKIGLTPVAGVTLHSAIVTDTNDIDQVIAMGRYGCILVDVANATPVAVTVNALGK